MTQRFRRHSLSALTAGFGAAAMFSLLACSPLDDELGGEEEVGDVDVATLRQELFALPFGFRPLAREPVPRPTNSSIIDQDAAIRLGKAFFWDIQVGSDGQVACAVCHASSGTDARRFNTLHPGLDGIFASGGVTGPGQTYTPVLIENDDIVGVQGLARRTFVGINPNPHIADEICDVVVDPVFGTERRLEFRQSLMIFGAVFFRHLFSAGEAQPEFNGLNSWGFTPNNLSGSLTRMENSALASQAVGPLGSSVEMRCTGRPINGPTNSLAAKMLARPPLQFQRVSPTDSVLGELADPDGPGLICGGAACTYRGMIEEAFGPAMAADAENIFTLIWGESVQAYQATLIPDQTPFDRFLAGQLNALTPRQIFGLIRFVGRGNCVACHAGPMLSDATVSFFEANGPINRDGGDQGFHNIGLLNSNLDGGRGSFGPGGAPISNSRSLFDDYAFRTPTLRNVKLTAPYFHTGSHPTLEDVVEFFDRGGIHPNPQKSADIFPLGLTDFDKRALVDFMANALTDCRVEKRRAPFDHPELPVPNGDHLPAVGAEGIGPCRR